MDAGRAVRGSRARDPGPTPSQRARAAGDRSGRWWLACEPASARVAREVVRSFLDAADGSPGDLDGAVLVVSELVSNAVRHAADRSPIELRVSLDDDQLRVEVGDGDSRPPRWTEAAPGDDHGRGLEIVEQVSRRWGWSANAGAGKSVWCELSGPEAGRPSGSR